MLAISLAATGLFVALFLPTFHWMAERFRAADSFYSHGWLIPVASAWLIWQRRAFLKTCPIRPSTFGLVLLVPAVVLHLVAIWGRMHVLSGFAMLAALGGLVWMMAGATLLWTLRFPLAFLLFMVPLPGVLLIAMSFKLKLLAAGLATHALNWLGLAAQQAGSMIHLPGGTSVLVDDTCSGLRSMISLLALATLWTSFLPPGAKAIRAERSAGTGRGSASATRWTRLAIVASAVPIAVIANMVRILILVLVAAIYGPDAAEGFIHYGAGVVVFGVSLMSLLWLSRRLVRSEGYQGRAECRNRKGSGRQPVVVAS